MRDIHRDLDVEHVRADELSAVLMSHFQRGRGSEQIMTYSRDDDVPLLELHLDKERAVSAIRAAAGFCDAEVAKLRERIADELGDAGVAFAQAIMLSHRPCLGAFRVGDHFQILPPPAEAPQPRLSFGLHPLLLEVAFATSPNGAVRQARAAAATREAALLLSVLLNADAVMEAAPSVHWAYAALSNNPASEVETGYRWAGRTGAATATFTDIKAFPLLQLLELDEYYGWVRGQPFDADLALPISLPALAEGYFALEARQRRKFLRAAYWMHHARRVYQLSPSDSFLATARAIEALLPPQAVGDVCGSCGRRQGQGPRGRFSEFVERLAGGVIPAPQRKAYYDLRSALTHGGKLLEAEFTAPMQTPFGMDIGQVVALREVARAVLYNWLREEILKRHAATESCNDPEVGGLG